jgi:hypothetical protein
MREVRGKIKADGTLAVFAGAKHPTGQTVLLTKVFLRKINFFIFHALCPAGLSAFCLMLLLFAARSRPSPL